MSDSLRTVDGFPGIGRILGDHDRRIRAIEDNSGGRELIPAFARDAFILASATPAVSLSYLPVSNESVHVYLGPLYLREGIDYTIAGQTLTLLSPAKALAGDVLEARYAYLGDIPLVPWADVGWRYLMIGISDSTDYSSPTFDDSSWSVGQAGFGYNKGDLPTNTVWPLDGRIWIRRTITTVSGVGITIQGRSDNYAEVYWNGTHVFSAPFSGAHDIWSVTVTGTGTDHLAVQATDDVGGGAGDGSYIDVEVSYT